MAVAAAALLAAPGALAHSARAPIPSGSTNPTTPTIDGTIGTSPFEWGNASQASYPLYRSSGAFFGTGTLYVENDGTYLYLALKVPDANGAGGAALRVSFDDNHDGVWQAGEDFLNADSILGPRDEYWANPGSPLDTSNGGTNDLDSAFGYAAGSSTIELRHPLCSADTAHDFCLAPGDTVGFTFGYANTVGDITYAHPLSSTNPAGWDNLVLYVPPPPSVFAGVLRQVTAQVSSGSDAVASSTSLTGARGWRGLIHNDSGASRSGAQISVDGSTAPLTPAVSFPVSGSAEAIAPGGEFDFDRLFEGPGSSQQTGVGFSSGYDASRALSTTTIQPGGTRQTVSATITLRSERYTRGNAQLEVRYGDHGVSLVNASIVKPTLDGGEIEDPTGSASGSVVWSAHDLVLGKPYTLKLELDVANSTTAAFSYKPTVVVRGGWNTGLPQETGRSTTIADDLLGGTFAYALGETVQWSRGLTDLDTVVLNGIAPPAQTPPANTTQPAIASPLGTLMRSGYTLTLSNGVWSGSPTGFGYRWLHCDSTGGSCVPISGATSSTYRLTGADIGFSMRGDVTATNAAGATTASSATTTTVRRFRIVSDSVVTAPTIDGAIGGDEWASAYPFPIEIQGLTGTAWVMDDGEFLYIAAKISDPSEGNLNSFQPLFDNNDDGVASVGDDAWIVNFQAGAYDDFWNGSYFESDTAEGAGGTNNTIGAALKPGDGSVTFEVRHPLCSGDRAHDLCLVPGARAGFNFVYQNGSGTTYNGFPSNQAFATSEYAGLLIGRDTTPPAVTVTAPSAGSTVSGTVDVAADVTDAGGIDHVDFRYFDGSVFHEISTDGTAPYTATWDTTTVPDSGRLGGTIYARAVDNAGNTTQNGNGITVANRATPTRVDVTLTPSAHTVEAGAAALDVETLPLSLALQPHTASSPIAQQPIAQQPIAQQPIAQQPIAQQPIAQQPLAGFGFDAAVSALGDVTLSSLPTTYPGGWPAIEQGTRVQDVPLQGVTLAQLLRSYPRTCDPSAAGSCGAPPALNGATGVRQLALADLDLSGSRLRSLPLEAFALAGLKLADLNPAPTDPTAVDQPALSDWCDAFAGPPISCTNPSTLAGETLMSAALKGAPIAQQPIAQQPIAQQPIAQQPIAQQPIAQQPIAQQPIAQMPIAQMGTSASPIAQQPIAQQDLGASRLNALPLREIVAAGSPLGGIAVASLSNPLAVVAGGTGATLADRHASNPLNIVGTLGDLASVADLSAYALGDIRYYGNLTVLDLLKGLPANRLDLLPAPDDYTYGDLMALAVSRAALAWENVPAARLARFGTNPAGRTTWSTAFTLVGAGVTPAAARISLPTGFRLVPGSVTLLHGESASTPAAAVAGQIVTVPLGSVALGSSYTLDFTTYAGATLGPADVQVSVTPTAVEAAGGSATGDVTVTDTFEGNDTPAAAAAIRPNDVELSYVSSKGDVDYYAIPAQPAGTRISVHLTNLTADLDLGLIAPAPTKLRDAAAGPPLAQAPVRDGGLDLSNVTDQLEPQGLRDSPIAQQPIAQQPIAQQSINRGTTDEDVTAVSNGAGQYLVEVAGYNGATTTTPYALRVQVSQPVEQRCPARAFPFSATAADRGAAPVGISATTNTLFLVDRTRLAQTYGSQGATDVIGALTNLAGKSTLGVNGVVYPVDSSSAIRALYDTWDTNPCSVPATNAVASALAGLVDDVRVTAPSLKYVVLVGGFDQIPPFVTPDLTQIANENEYASTFAGNQYAGWLTSASLLTDEPYFDTDPTTVDDTQFSLGDLVGGRLVETPAEIAGAANRFVSFNGRLDRSTAFSSGYDFVKDGAQAVADNEKAYLGAANVQTLIDDSWNASSLLAALLPASGTTASLNTLNGHFDHYRALSAQGNSGGTLDVYSTADIDARGAGLAGRVLFSVGCHAGLPVADAVVGTSTPARDWAQALAGKGALWAANTGFGLGDTETVAYSEQLMALYAKNLNGSLTVGEALTRAKQDYFLERPVLSAYDRKSLQEATFYGLPFYAVGPAAAAPAAPASTPGTSASTAPADSALAADPASGVQSAAFAVTPSWSVTPIHSATRGDYYSNGGAVDVVNYRPIVPKVSMAATRAGVRAHSAFIESLASTDERPFDPVYAMPTEDRSAFSPEPTFGDAAYPSALVSVASAKIGSGIQSRLNVDTGQFFTDPSVTTRGNGVFRRFTQITGRVFYSSSTSYVAPTILSTSAVSFGGNVGFTVSACDSVRVYVLFHEPSGAWRGTDLARDTALGSCRWTGGATAGAQVEYFVQACNADGNCASSSNKARYYNAAPAPTQSGTVQLAVAPASGSTVDSATGYYSGPVEVSATAPAGLTLQRTIDGVTTAYGGTFTVSGDGLHVVRVDASDGQTATTAFLIDGTAPTISITSPREGSTFVVGDVVRADYACKDPGSGVKSCVGTKPNGTATDTSTIGTHVFTVDAADFLGHTTQKSVATWGIYRFSGFFQPISNQPTINVVQPGRAVPVKFSLNGNKGLGIFSAGYPKAYAVSCTTGSPLDVITDAETVTAGSSSLSYDAGSDTYSYVWKTPSPWASGSCMQFDMLLIDKSMHRATFRAK